MATVIKKEAKEQKISELNAGDTFTFNSHFWILSDATNDIGKLQAIEFVDGELGDFSFGDMVFKVELEIKEL